MGGRLILTSVQLTFVFKGEHNEEFGEALAVKLYNNLPNPSKEGEELIEIFHDETQTHDVEV